LALCLRWLSGSNPKRLYLLTTKLLQDVLETFWLRMQDKTWLLLVPLPHPQHDSGAMFDIASDVGSAVDGWPLPTLVCRAVTLVTVRNTPALA